MIYWSPHHPSPNGGTRVTAQSVKFLTQQQTQDLADLAEQARLALTEFAGGEVRPDGTALQLLDEMIDRHLKHSPAPSYRLRLSWASFLGEVFRQHHRGIWVIASQEGGRPELSILCTVGDTARPIIVNVTEDVNRRISQGMAASLSYAYVAARIELATAEGAAE